MSSRPALAFDAAVAAARALGLPQEDLGSEAAAEAVKAAWERMDAPARAVMGALAELGGACGGSLLADEAASELEAAGDKHERALGKAEAAIIEQWEAGLLARDRASRTFYLLPEVTTALVPLVRDAVLADLPPLGSPPLPPVDEHLLSCALNVLRHEPLKLTREGTPFRRGLETLAEKLGPLLGGAREKNPAARAQALVAVMRDLHLVRAVRDSLEVDLAAAEAWADLDDAARATALMPLEASAPAGRLLRLLQQLGPDRAWPDAVASRVLRRAILASGDDEPAEPAPRGEHAQLFLSAASALERAGLAGRPGTHPGTLALTPLGRAFPGEPSLPRPQGMHVGHDLAVLVPRGLPPSVHFRLGEVARLEAADQVARYRLDRAVVLEALDRGATPGELELFLAEHATPVLPDSVRDDLRRWSERFGEVTSHAGICVACAVPRRHDEFDAVVKRSGLSIVLVAPGIAVVAPEDHAALCEALAAAGLTPRRRIRPLPRGASSAAPPRPAPASASAPWADTAGLAANLAEMPAWGARVRAVNGRKAAPPPRLVAAQVKEKYRREFGSGQLAALDRLEVDELISMEEKGLVRQFLAGKIPVGSARRATDLDEYVADEMVSVTPLRARQVMERAAQSGLTCQVAYLQGPGRTQRLLVEPVELVSDGAGSYIRARVPGSGQERMLATDRIHALRVVRPGAKA